MLNGPRILNSLIYFLYSLHLILTAAYRVELGFFKAINSLDKGEIILDKRGCTTRKAKAKMSKCSLVPKSDWLTSRRLFIILLLIPLIF